MRRPRLASAGMRPARFAPFGVLALTLVLAGGAPARAAGTRLPHEKHVFPNGFTLILHEDHATPIVAVNLWYHVGSKNEKKGKTGFAHLFEHMMFQGSQHHDRDFIESMEPIGATDLNGTTNFDRTCYFENVPPGALEHVLSVDAVRTYKPAPAVYALAPRALGLDAADLLFVSSNAWDVAGAKAFGYQVAWCNRQDAPEEELGVRADLIVRRLDELPA